MLCQNHTSTRSSTSEPFQRRRPSSTLELTYRRWSRPRANYATWSPSIVWSLPWKPVFVEHPKLSLERLGRSWPPTPASTEAAPDDSPRGRDAPVTGVGRLSCLGG